MGSGWAWLPSSSKTKSGMYRISLRLSGRAADHRQVRNLLIRPTLCRMEGRGLEPNPRKQGFGRGQSSNWCKNWLTRFAGRNGCFDPPVGRIRCDPDRYDSESRERLAASCTGCRTADSKEAAITKMIEKVLPEIPFVPEGSGKSRNRGHTCFPRSARKKQTVPSCVTTFPGPSN
jgi:hypothetical protein